MEKLRNTKTLTIAAMLTAIGILLGFFKIPINQLIEIRFGSLPICMAGMMFGPGIAGVIGALVDVGGFLVKPTGPYFPGFTISGVVSGVIFGLLLYKKKPTLPRVIAVQVVHTLIVGILMNSYWLDMLYLQMGFVNTIIYRLPKELIMLPINIIMIYTLLKALDRIRLYERV